MKYLYSLLIAFGIVFGWSLINPHDYFTWMLEVFHQARNNYDKVGHLAQGFVSIATGASGDAFLGTQGDIWDTQSDMLYATIGAVLGLLIFSRYQDKQIKKISPE